MTIGNVGSAEPTTDTKGPCATAAIHDENHHAGNIPEEEERDTPTAVMTVTMMIATIITEIPAPPTQPHMTNDRTTANAVTRTTIATAPLDPMPP